MTFRISILQTEHDPVIKTGTNPWQLPILYDLYTDRMLYNSDFNSDDIFNANKVKEPIKEI